MNDQWSRTRALLGPEAMERLSGAHVAVFGLGGVGSYAAMALTRSGVGALTLVDHDRVALSNLNRQYMAYADTVGMKKTLALEAELRRICSDMTIHLREVFVCEESLANWDFTGYDYLLDCVDTVTAKIQLILKAREAGVPVLSCMGMGNKWDASKILVEDLDKTTICPLARVMRRELGKRGVKHVKVVYSQEKSDTVLETEARFSGRPSPASLVTVPATAGLIMAGETIQDLIKGAKQ